MEKRAFVEKKQLDNLLKDKLGTLTILHQEEEAIAELQLAYAVQEKLEEKQTELSQSMCCRRVWIKTELRGG